MASAEFSAAREGPLLRATEHVRAARPPAARLVLWALIALVLVAVFDHGGVDEAASARIGVAVAGIGLVAAVAWLWTGTLRFAAATSAKIALGLLLAFCVWSALSVLWSVDADNTWVEANRAVLYLITLGLATACGASWRRSGEVLTAGLELVAGAVALYAIGQKVLPGLRLGGLSLDQTGAIPRLQEPLGYWNALALLLAVTGPAVLLRATDPRRRHGARIASLALFGLLAVTIAFTLSRGGFIALFVALAVFVARGGRPLRSLLWIALGLAGAVPGLVFGLVDHRLSDGGVGLAPREHAGLILLVLLTVGLGSTALLAARALDLERRVEPPLVARQRIWRALGALTAMLVVVGVVAVALSGRGLGGTVSHTWHSFTATHAASVTEPTRLLSADSANRWVWWKEALGGFSDRPVAGWGAGSFPVVHLLYRRDTLSVNQPHSVPLQWLSETGVVGFVLGAGALVLLLVGGSRAVGRARTPSEVAVRAGLLAALAGYLIHSFYDWDWDIPGVTLPFLVCAGVLAGSDAFRGGAAPAAARSGKAGALALAAMVLSVAAVSAALPSLAATRASDALVSAAGGSASDLDAASRDAQAARALDPLSDAGPRAQAAIAERRGQRRAARADLLQAIHRDPTDPSAWTNLAFIELQLGDLVDGEHAAERARQLDPLGSTSSVEGDIAALLAVRGAPPQRSATAVRTP